MPTRRSLAETLRDQPFFFAPMAGISDLPGRRVMSRHGAGSTVTELVSVQGWQRSPEKTEPLLGIPEEDPCPGIQLVGCDPSAMADVAADFSRTRDCSYIDINMGCPARKVIKARSGVALMGDPERAEAIMKSVVAASSKPVTVKMRSGISHTGRECLDLGRRAENAGVAAIFLHARSREQGFSGPPDLSMLKELKESLSIPVIGNGGIESLADGQAMFRGSGCDGLMVGRGCLGRPWLFQELAAWRDDDSSVPPPPDRRETVAMIRQHAREAMDFNGSKALVPFRKHLLWYTRGWPDSAKLRSRLTLVTVMEEMEDILASYFEEHPDE